MKYGVSVLAVGVGLLCSPSLFAKDIQSCMEIVSDKQRLACFDAYAKAHYQKQENKFGKTKFDDIPETKVFIVKAVTVNNKKYTITLDNGQQWRQVADARTLRLAEHDKVIIESGALSAYYLRKAGSRVKTKFKRIDNP